MLEMVIFDTNSDEGELLFKLVGRGRHADIPFYQSVESYDIEKGIVVFSRLDCGPADSFKVGVAGNKIITTKRFLSHVGLWLSDWGIPFTKESKKVASRKAARQLFGQMRKETRKGRKQKLAVARRVIGRFQEARDADLLNLRSAAI